jgi:hypothetical protein
MTAIVSSLQRLRCHYLTLISPVFSVGLLSSLISNLTLLLDMGTQILSNTLQHRQSLLLKR